jgi:MSHA biogenesis protein MshM
MHELGIEPVAAAPGQTPGRHQLLAALRDCLLGHAQAGRHVLVCIDEAQAIPIESVESLRLLSNLETEKRKLLQLVLLGQPELDTKLARPEIRQLLQRITFSEYLGPILAQRVPGYLAHRLATAAMSEATDTAVFEPDAAQSIAEFSAGVPRLINVLAHKCLMLAYGENVHRVSLAHVRLAAADTPGVQALAGRRLLWWQRWRSKLWTWRRPALTASGSGAAEQSRQGGLL